MNAVDTHAQLAAAYRAGEISTDELKRALLAFAPIPLSVGQKGLWALHKTWPDIGAYVIPLAFRCERPLDVAALERAYRHTLASHPLLTTRLVDVQGEPALQPRSPEGFGLRVHDAGAAGGGEMVERLRASAKRPLPLEGDALIDAEIHRAGDACWYALIRVHHIVFDGTSAVLFLNDLFDAYLNLLRGAPPRAAAAAATFREFVDWQRAMLDAPQGERHLDHWRDALDGAPAPLALPTDQPRGEQASFDGRSLRAAVPPALHARVAAFCDAHDVSRAVLYLGVFNGLLSRYAQRADIVVGMPALGRPEARFEACVGYFVNMLPIRSRNVQDVPALDYLRDLRETLFDALEHADYPFPALLKALKVPRDGRQRPLFDVAFAYQNFAHGHWLEQIERDYAAPLGVRMIDDIRQEGEYELELEVIERAGGATLNLKYAGELYDRTRAERIVAHFLHLLDGVLAHPARPLADHDILTDGERALIERCNATARPIPRIAHFVEWIAKQAAHAPQKIAVRHGDVTLDYATLMRDATALGNYLRARGIGPGAKVAICVERSPDLLRATLGVALSGAAYVPLDPRYPAQRQRYMLDDSGASLLLTQAAIERDWTPGCPTLFVDRERERIAAYADSVVPERTALDDDALAYLIYTSGSTGKPKGVMVTHRALNNFLGAMGELLDVQAGDTMLALTTFSFDIAALELFLPLVRGAECVLCDTDVAADAERLKTFVETVRPSAMQATPTTWQMLFQVGWHPSPALKVLCGGEALPPALLARFAASGARCWNLYGPTETTIWSSAKRLDGASRVTIGAPIANTRLYVLNAHRRMQPPGAPGELAIAGAGLAAGYHRLPAQTAEKFVDDPFHPGERMFLTGDLAVRDGDGDVRCLGRRDHQIKLRGHRIDVEEIEACLIRQGTLDAAAVVLHEAPSRPPCLVAYVVPRAGDVSSAALKAELGLHLPAYMVPQRIVFDTRLPTTANGKIDRRALIERPLQPTADDAASAPARAGAEGGAGAALVRAAWEAVLGYPIDDDAAGFFDFGGDSVSAVQVAQRLGERIGRKIEVTLLFRHPTIARLGAVLDEMGATACATPSEQADADGGAAMAARVAGDARPSPAAQAPGAPTSGHARSRSVAVIGISCEFAESADVDAFWANLCNGRACVTRWSDAELEALGVPEATRRNPRFVPAKAVIEHRGAFDAAFFGLSPRDAGFMSPAFRHLLMHAWRAFEDAGQVPSDAPRTAVYMSAGQGASGDTDAARGAYWIEEADEYVRWLMAQGGSIPTMISHKLGLTGPSVFVQSNCSSSLVALQAGLESIRSGAADYALVGAANVFAAPVAGYLHQPGLNFSSNGQCRAFDDAADGMVGGEGVAVLLLKRAELALADGDAVYAWLDEVQVNNDGALKAGFFAPSAAGQAEVIRGTLARAGVAPADVGYVETHGTGTALGDPIEFAALSDAFGTDTGTLACDGERCGLGSVKSNIGHTDTVAGLAGAIKAILSLRHGMIPPTLHVDAPAKRLDLEHSPFALVERVREWPSRDGKPRYAAVSSFGVGGTNAHALFRSADDVRSTSTSTSPSAATGARAACVVLSAKTRDKLVAAAQQMLAFARRCGPLPGFRAAAYTLQTGRVAWTHRLAIVARDWDDVRRALASFVAGDADAAVHVGDTKRSVPPVGTLDAHDDAHALARHWAAGGEVRWAPGPLRPPRVHLPTYPFITARELIDMPFTARDADTASSTAAPASRVAPVAAAARASVASNTSVAPIARGRVVAAVPCWERCAVMPGGTHDAGLTVVVCAGREVPLPFMHARRVDPGQHGDAAALERLVRAHPDVDHWVWLLPDDAPGTPAEMAAQQRWGVLWGAAFLRALGGAHGSKPLKLTVVTRRAVAILAGDPVTATHAGVHGLVGTVVNEHPHWRARIVDLDDADGADEAAARALDALPFERGGRPWARRRGDWFRPALRPVDDALVARAAPGGREGGVYVVVGGAGAIGQDWSEHMMRAHRAQLVWIGRRAQDDAITAAIRRLEALGPAPVYIQADAADARQLARARDEIRARFAHVRGVVHAAMLHENQPLHRQSADAFERNLSAKVTVALNLVDAFDVGALDFLLFFSSVNEFYLNPNCAAYAAGGTFIASFADQLNQRGAGRAKVIHWGHWETPRLRDDAHGARRHLARAGFGTLDPASGMALLDMLLTQPFERLAAFSIVHAGGAAPLHFSDMALHAKAPAAVPAHDAPQPAGLTQAQDMIDVIYGRVDDIAPLLCALLWRQIAAFAAEAGLAADGRRGRYSLDALRAALGRGNYLARWVDASIRILADRDDVMIEGDALIVSADVEARAANGGPRWEATRAGMAGDPFMTSVTRFIDVALQATPDVLAGRKKATDVFFSASSMALVESIYKENPVVHYYGTVVAALVAARIEAIVAANPAARVRLLEVGAGTGSCSEHVLRALKPFAAHVDEYCFTDLSQLFLQRAERRYRGEHPYLTTKILDLEKNPFEQGFAAEHYEFVIAANVVHATQDIRTSVRHMQSLMKHGGRLLLLELSGNSLFSHLTFGLLEGWWRFGDGELREPYGPALSAASWRDVLLDQGYERIAFPCERLHGSDLQIVTGDAAGYGIGPRRDDEAWPDPGAPQDAHGSDSAWADGGDPAPAPASGGAAPTSVADVPLAGGDARDSGEARNADRAHAMEAPAAPPSPDAVDAARAVLLRVICEALQQRPADIDPDESLGDYGLDSIVGVKLVQQINDALGVELVAGALFEFNTLNKLARHVAQVRTHSEHEIRPVERDGAVCKVAETAETAETGAAPTATAAAAYVGLDGTPGEHRSVSCARGPSGDARSPREDAAARAVEPAAPRTERVAAESVAAASGASPERDASPGSRAPRRRDLAIVGMSGQFPGAPSLDAFWRNIEAGVDCTGEVPAERWDWRACFGQSDGVSPRTLSKWGGFIDDVYAFDPLFFDLSPYEAAVMDPQQRLLIKHAWLALDDAGIAPKAFAERRTGVFMAIGASEYAYTAQLPVGSPLVASALSSSMVANRLSHLMNLRGPSEHCDTGCSSSLVALHRAMSAIDAGECEQALVGGVQLVLSPLGAINLGAVGFLSPTGRARSFQAGADGFVRAEGVGVIVLKPLDVALADGDDVYAIVKGTGVAHGGKGVSLTAPNAQGMKTAIAQALERADVPAASLTYVEAHGIASEIGDSIEFQALKSAFGPSSDGQCALGSLKPVIGHAEIASGIAALMKTALALRRRVRPGVPGFEGPGAHVPLERSPFSIRAACRDWPAGPSAVRRAGVHGFGFGGVNAFAVLEESAAAPAAPARDTASRPRLLPLSAKSDASLLGNARALLAYLERSPDTDLASLAATLWRRTAFPCRLAVVAPDVGGAIDALRAFVDGEPNAGLHVGDAAGADWIRATFVGSAAVEALVRTVRDTGDDAMLARLWCGGIDNGAQPPLDGVRRLHLPGYAFDERICRLPPAAGWLALPGGADAAAEPASLGVERAAGERNGADNAGSPFADDSHAELRSMLSALLQLAPQELDFERPIRQYGVDSLLAVMLRNRLNDAYGTRLTLAELTDCRTFAELAERLPATLRRTAKPAVSSGGPGGPDESGDRDYPCSIGQRGLWIEQRHYPARVGYNVPYAFEIDGDVEPERVFAAAGRVFEQHPLLSANFHLDGDALRLRIGTHASPRCTAHPRWSGSPAALTQWLRELARQPFDLERDALLRVDVVPGAAGDQTVVLFTFHHAVFDGSSLPVFLDAFVRCYEAGAHAQLPAMRASYADFAAWQRDWLASADGAHARAFWLRRLGGEREPLRLPGGHDACASGEGGRLTLVADVPAATLDGLDALAARSGASRYCVMLAAFASVLRERGDAARGQNVRIATPFFGRPHERFEDLIGYFVNLLVIPVDARAPHDPVERLRSLQRELLDAFEHGHYPYACLHEALGHPEQPLFDAVFMYQNWIRPMQRRLADTPVRMRPVMDVRQQVDFPLAFEALETARGVTLLCHFDAAVYSTEWIESIRADYLALLARWPAEAARDAGLPAADGLASSDGERAAVDTRALVALFDAQVARTPSGTALIHDGRRLDYASLDAYANRFARAMRAAWPSRAGADRVVALLLEPGFAFVAAALAAWKTGAAYLALDPALPAERLAQMSADSGAALLVTDAVARGRLESGPFWGALPCVDADALDERAAPGMPNASTGAGEPDAGQTCCYVIYTSGSSGKPKGVRGSVRGTLNRLEWGWRAFPYADDDVCCQKTSLNFVDHVAELFSPLLRGIPTLILGDRPLRERGAAWFAAELARHRVTRIVAIPSLLRVLLREPQAARSLASLRLCFSSGEPLPRDLADAFHACCEHAVLVNLYGSSEMSADASCKRVGRDETGIVSIGRPIDGVRMLVVDARGCLCADGVEGEVLVGGLALAEGYAGESAASDTRFVTVDPDGAGPQRCFRSGDLGYRRSDGEFVLIGRRDRQVKVNGQRVEPGEIEAALRAHVSVVDAIVAPGVDGIALEAFVELREPTDGATLRAHLARTLPLALLPGRFYHVAALPRLASGKLDRASVRAADARLLPFDAGATGGAASGDEARALAVVASVLGVPAETLDVDQDFHQLGFDSFRFVRLADALNGAFGTRSTPADFYRHGTTRKWLASVAAAASDRAASAAISAAASGPTATATSTAIHEPTAFATPASSIEPVEPMPADAAITSMASTPALADAAIPVAPPVAAPVAPAAPILAAAPMPGVCAATPVLPAAADGAIAVIGIAGVMPGCDDLDSFWRSLRDGVDLIREAPAERWNWRDYAGQPGGDALRWGGFVNDVDKFSPAFFGLSPLEAEYMDPQHRLFLETAWHALEDAGYAPRSLPERSVGVFVGASSMDYASMLMTRGEVDPLANFGNGHSMIANRVSYLLDLRGPSVALDTACSSSLVAIHEGINAIRRGDCRLAIVGGVNVLLEPRITLSMGRARMLSPSGRCRTFAADADGYVRGEGAGAMILKPLAAALADGDPVHAVIRGSAVNHGGRANSMTAPNPAAQAALVSGLYRRLGIRAGDVSYVETHGTGTPIGDPIEINALKEVWRDASGGPATRCALGAVKTNVGHLEAAAGIAGALKIVLSLRHRTLAPNLHGATPNPYIDLHGTPFHLPSSAAPWPSERGAPRLAGLSSFGIGGTNAHVLFEEFPGNHHAE